MTKVFLIVSVACNVWFLSLLLYDRIMEAKLIRFFRHIAGLWRSLDCTAAEQGKDKDMPHADTSDIIGKSRFKMASTRTTAAIPAQEAATSEKALSCRRKRLLLTTETRKPSHARHKYRRTNSMKPLRASLLRNWSTERMNWSTKNLTKSRLREAVSRILIWLYAPYGRIHRPVRKCDTPERS